MVCCLQPYKHGCFFGHMGKTNMTYSSHLSKSKVPTFAELYRIVAGSAVYYYTSYQADYVYNGNTYKAVPIKRGEFSFSERLRAVRVNVSAPLAGPFLQYIATAPPQLVEIKITRVFIDTPTDNVELFNGYVISVTIDGQVASAECESETRMLRNKVPKYLFQARCNHVLFDSVCGLTEATYAVNGTITDIDGSDITATAYDALADGYFVQGVAKFTHPTNGLDIRLITNHVGGVLTLQFPFSGLVVGNTVTAYPGCDKSYDTCNTKFSNLANRLSFDTIPSSNPVMWGFK